MKSNYEKYMSEVWETKEKLYEKYLKSGYKSFLAFLGNEIKLLKINYHEEKTAGKRTLKVAK